MQTLPGDGTVDMLDCLSSAARRDRASRSPAAETFAIRLSDGSQVDWTAQQIVAYEGNWEVNLARVNVREWTDGYSRLLACLAHGDSVTCEVCGND
jgi:urease accessory protein UreH